MTDTRQDDPQTESNDATELSAVIELVSGALTKMGLQVQVDGRVDGRFMRLNVTGADADELVTGEGAAANSHVLDALQLVVMRRQAGESSHTVVIDSGGFREHRLDELAAAAERLGDRVAETGDDIRVWGMNSFDRRAVHLALKERPDVRTDSEGDGVFRVLAVSAAKGKGDRKSSHGDDD